jgi:hypothetical protein
MRPLMRPREAGQYSWRGPTGGLGATPRTKTESESELSAIVPASWRPRVNYADPGRHTGNQTATELRQASHCARGFPCDFVLTLP